MTCVTTIRDKDGKWAIMMADRRKTSAGGTICPNHGSPKIWNAKLGGHECLVGGSGSLRYMEIAQHLVKVDRRRTEPMLEGYLRRVWVPGLRKALEVHGQLGSKNGMDDLPVTSALLFVTVREIILLGTNFLVTPILESHFALGSGEGYAFGSLDTSADTEMAAEARLLKALSIAEKHASDVGGPFDKLTLPFD